MLATSSATAAWLSAWAAVGAAVGTFLAFMIALWALHKQIDAGLKVQAARILFEIEGDMATGSFIIRNMSDLPIGNLEGLVFLYKGRLSPGRSYRLLFDQDRLAAGGEARAPVPSLESHGDLSAVTSFRDASGSTWRRQLPSGELRLMKLGPRRVVKNSGSYGLLVFFFAGLQIVDMINHGPSVGGVIIAAVLSVLGASYMRIAFTEALLGFRWRLPKWPSPTSDGPGEDRQPSEQG